MRGIDVPLLLETGAQVLKLQCFGYPDKDFSARGFAAIPSGSTNLVAVPGGVAALNHRLMA